MGAPDQSVVNTILSHEGGKSGLAAGSRAHGLCFLGNVPLKGNRVNRAVAFKSDMTLLNIDGLCFCT